MSRAAKKGACVIDCSTIDVQTSKEMAEMARSKQIRFVDAPVSGGAFAEFHPYSPSPHFL